MRSFKRSLKYHSNTLHQHHCIFLRYCAAQKLTVCNENTRTIRVNEQLMGSVVTDDVWNLCFTRRCIGNKFPYVTVLHAVVTHAGLSQRRVFLHKICLFLKSVLPCKCPFPSCFCPSRPPAYALMLIRLFSPNTPNGVNKLSHTTPKYHEWMCLHAKVRTIWGTESKAEM